MDKEHIKGAADKASGAVKEGIGKATGDASLEAKGKLDKAKGEGRVVETGWHKGYGNCVRISHGYGYETLYGHMSKITARRGEKVTKGQKIGEVGDTGLSTAPHLHYEVHYKGNPINPINFCMDNLTPQEYQQMVNSANKANQSLD